MASEMPYSPVPLSPTNSGYSSPIGSDTVQTPFIERHSQVGHVRIESPGQKTFIGNAHQTPGGSNGGALAGYKSDAGFANNYYCNSPFSSEVSAGSLTSVERNPFEAAFSDSKSRQDVMISSELSPVRQDLQEDRTSIETHVVFKPVPDYASYRSSQFPESHQLNPHFLESYSLEDELGSGGYGFVMTARNRIQGHEVAVKFIIKDKVPDYAWTVDEVLGRLPTEVMLLSLIEHPNIVKCLDLFEDSLYFYMVQELHGSPWYKSEKSRSRHMFARLKNSITFPIPLLAHSSSDDSVNDLGPATPPPCEMLLGSSSFRRTPPLSSSGSKPSRLSASVLLCRPKFSRRPSHDLFECIEQSEHKRLTENQARYVFAQVVEAVHYLDKQGVSHRDLKDENIVIDQDFKVKLIDFGSAIIADPAKPRPFYDLFFGTTAYAASEILLKKPYQAPPAEVWTLGVLLSYLLTGTSPFPTVQDAIRGKILLGHGEKHVSSEAMDLMRRCLHPNPSRRATIREVKDHRWLMCFEIS